GPRSELGDRCSYLACGGGVRWPLQEQAGVTRVVGEGLAERAEKFFESLSAGALQRMVGGRQDLLKRELQQFIDQGVLADEPAVDGADADASAGGDLLDAGVGAGLAKHFACGGEYSVMVPHGVASGGR